MKAAFIANDSERPTVIGGDLNATPWEDAIELMQHVGRLIDPRQGYGYVPTYDALSLWMSWPLDQVFYQAGFAVVSLERLEASGSDHYPFMARLCRIPAQRGQAPPAPDPEAVKQARRTIELALERSFRPQSDGAQSGSQSANNPS